MSANLKLNKEEFETIDDVGSFLKATRENLKISVNKVSEDTKIRSEWVNILESGSYDNLPGKVYAIGFVRTYAEYLGLNADAVVLELQASPYFSVEEEIVSVKKSPISAKKRFKFKTLLISAITVLALLSFFSYVKGDQEGLGTVEQDETD